MENVQKILQFEKYIVKLSKEYIDYNYLYKAGVAAIFGPGSPVAKAACTILEILLEE